MPDPAPMTEPLAALSLPMAVADLPARRASAFHLRPDAGQRAELARDLDLLALRKLDFRGTLAPDGARDWRLEGTLGATVVQPCIITAEPVTTRLDVPVTRRFLAQMPEPEGDESEIPDDSLEPLGTEIDPGAVMVEALALALPDYPRASGAELGEIEAAPPGAAPLRTESPFAALRALKGGADTPGGSDT